MIGPSRRVDWIIVGAVALTLHLVYLSGADSDPTFDHPIVDAKTYHRTAMQIASGQTGETEVFPEPPLYPHFLGLVYALAGPRILMAKLVQSLLGVGTCLLTLSIGRRVGDRRVGLIAGLVTAVSGPLIFFNTQLLATGLVVLGSVLAVRLLIASLDRRRWYTWLLCGISIGATALAKPTILLPFVVLIAGLMVTALRRKSRAPAIGALACGLGVFLCIAPITLLNIVRGGEFVLIASNGGANLYIGNNENAEQTIAIRPGTDWLRLMSLPVQEANARSPAEVDGYFYGKVWAFVREHPASFIGGLGEKALRFIHGREIPRTIDVYLHARYSRLLSNLVGRWGVVWYPFGVIAPLAVLGAAVSWRRNRLSRLLVFFVLLYAGSVVLFFTASRYRQPVVPILSVLAAFGVVWLFEQYQAGRWRAMARGGLVLLPSAVLVNWPIRTSVDQVNFAAEMRHFVGISHQRQDQPEEAERFLRDAVRLDPDYADAHVSLGNLLMREGKPMEGIAHFERALASDPTHAQAHSSLGMVAMQQGEWARARDHFEQSVAALPTMSDTRHKLAICLMQLDEPARAVDQLRASLRLTPSNRNAQRLLGFALVTADRLEEARDVARTILSDDPQDGYAHHVLGRVAAAEKRFAEAMHHYQTALDSDAVNSELQQDLERAGAALRRERTTSQPEDDEAR